MTLLKHTLLVAACALASTSTLAHDKAGYTETVEKTFAVNAQSQLQVENTNGKVVIEAWDKNEVSITASISAKNKESRDRIEVVLLQKDNIIEIETDYKKQSGWNNNNYSKVDYFINVPKSIDLDEVDLTNGSLNIKGVTGEVNASLINGRFVGTGLGANTTVESNNGSVELSYIEDLNNLSNIDIESQNGSITLYLPDTINAKVKANTRNGSIKNEFGLEVDKRRSNSKRLSGEIGSGTARVNLESNNGSIRIKRL